MALHNVFVVGAPKAGTTALRAVRAQHPQLYLSPVKEPKFFMCDGRRPRGFGQRGPGDAHSAREWVWRRSRYEALFEAAPAGLLRGESTPFYLYDRQAHRRIRDAVPDAKLIAVVRDPVDRAYSNWMHLWSDGLEPISDFRAACRAEDSRVEAGWAPFWHYRRLGLYGEQLEHLHSLFPAEQIMVMRYRELVEEPVRTLDAVCRFLGVRTGVISGARPENTRPYVPPSRRTELFGKALRGGAAVGGLLPPQVWRRASRPVLRALHTGDAKRPVLPAEVRRELVQEYADDIRLLERLTGRDFGDWVGDTSRGQFSSEANATSTRT